MAAAPSTTTKSPETFTANARPPTRAACTSVNGGMTLDSSVKNFGHGEGSDWIVSEVWWWSAKDSHNDFIRLLNQQGLLGLGGVLLVLAVWARIFPPGVAAPLLAALVASTAFSNGIMFRPQASLLMPLALVAAADAWQRRQARSAGP